MKTRVRERVARNREGVEEESEPVRTWYLNGMVLEGAQRQIKREKVGVVDEWSEWLLPGSIFAICILPGSTFEQRENQYARIPSVQPGGRSYE